MSKITSGDPRPARGRQRQAELAVEMQKAVQINSEIMLRGLGRPYSIGEKFIAEAICELHFRAHKLRNSGRSDVSVLIEAARLQQGSIFAVLTPGHSMPLIDPSTEGTPAPSAMVAQ